MADRWISINGKRGRVTRHEQGDDGDDDMDVEFEELAGPANKPYTRGMMQAAAHGIAAHRAGGIMPAINAAVKQDRDENFIPTARKLVGAARAAFKPKGPTSKLSGPKKPPSMADTISNSRMRAAATGIAARKAGGIVPHVRKVVVDDANSMVDEVKKSMVRQGMRSARGEHSGFGDGYEAKKVARKSQLSASTHWHTLDPGIHVMVDDDGVVVNGPAHLIGLRLGTDNG